MKKSITVKVLKKFPSPLTNRMAEIGEEMNVLPSIFWLRRIEHKDCVQIKKKTQPVKSKPQVEKEKSKARGSK